MNYGVVVEVGKTLLVNHAESGTRYQRKVIQLKDVNIFCHAGL
jgi:hypothetical protein